jgi:hypothetical protein
LVIDRRCFKRNEFIFDQQIVGLQHPACRLWRDPVHRVLDRVLHADPVLEADGKAGVAPSVVPFPLVCIDQSVFCLEEREFLPKKKNSACFFESLNYLDHVVDAQSLIGEEKA